jgi:hypothetical protein
VERGHLSIGRSRDRLFCDGLRTRTKYCSGEGSKIRFTGFGMILYISDIPTSKHLYRSIRVEYVCEWVEI